MHGRTGCDQAAAAFSPVLPPLLFLDAPLDLPELSLLLDLPELSLLLDLLDSPLLLDLLDSPLAVSPSALLEPSLPLASFFLSSDLLLFSDAPLPEPPLRA